MDQPNRTYFAARAVTSRDRAKHAASPSIAAIHVELAAKYERLAADPDQTIYLASPGSQCD